MNLTKTYLVVVEQLFSLQLFQELLLDHDSLDCWQISAMCWTSLSSGRHDNGSHVRSLVHTLWLQVADQHHASWQLQWEQGLSALAGGGREVVSAAKGVSDVYDQAVETRRRLISSGLIYSDHMLYTHHWWCGRGSVTLITWFTGVMWLITWPLSTSIPRLNSSNVRWC